MTGALDLRTGYFSDRPSFLALVDLLRETFDIDIGQLDRMGGPDPTAMPFGYFDDAGRCVANFSAFSMPLIIQGRTVRAVGYQSGAVRPDYRGQGLYRDLMRRAFGWAEAQGYEMGLLLTDKPGLYEPYGFHIVEQHMFVGPMPVVAAAGPSRTLTIENHEDVKLIRSILAERMPVSNRFAVVGQAVEFLLNASFDPSIHLSHMAGHDAVIAWREDGGTLHLLDIAGRTIPTLSEVISALQTDAGRVAVHFPTDRLGWIGRTERHGGSCELMVRRDTDALDGSGPIRLSPMSDF